MFVIIVINYLVLNNCDFLVDILVVFLNVCIFILRGLKEKYEAHHGIRRTDDALVAAVNDICAEDVYATLSSIAFFTPGT